VKDYGKTYNCDGMCQFSNPRIAVIFTRRVQTLGFGIFDRALANEYLTPGEVQQVNNAADEAHNVAHWLAEREADTDLRGLGIELPSTTPDNPYEYRYPTFGEGA
jgi:hypothetical protein